ncbi:hypothetical protein GCM10023108_49740 [Saccharopolyspora hordei]
MGSTPYRRPIAVATPPTLPPERGRTGRVSHMSRKVPSNDAGLACFVVLMAPLSVLDGARSIRDAPDVARKLRVRP